MKDVICKKCNWSWNIELNDIDPYLCHSCGYDDKLNKYDLVKFNQWKQSNTNIILTFKEEQINKNIFIRIFDVNIDPIELMWHRDNENRTIESLNVTDWMIQFDNELPIKIEGIINIKKHQYHRLIKGSNKLTIKLIKH